MTTPPAPRRRTGSSHRPPITKRQKEILDFFQRYVAAHEISPTLEEIAQAFGLNKVTVFGHIAELERKGILRRSAPNISRGLRVISPPQAGRERAGGTGRTRITRGHATPADTTIPILGRIAAGAPIETLEDPEPFTLLQMTPPGADVYLLRVQGNSMIEDAICDGDLVLVERRSTAHNGQVVVAVLADETATLKRLYREPASAGRAERFRLQPANADLAPLFVDQVDVRGVVIGVIRRL